MTTTRRWRSSDVYSYCVKFNRYTRGDNEAYRKMLDFVSNHESPSDLEILEVAHDIYKHSELDQYGQSDAENLNMILGDLFADCIHYEATADAAELELYLNRI